MNANQLLTTLLKDVSRSFYLTMRILPADIRPQISVAYLLARTSDTIADTGLVAPDKRAAALGKFRMRFLGKSSEPLQFGDLAQNQSSPAEKVLLERVEDSLAVLTTFPPEDVQRIREVLTTITSGQELDLLRFAHGSEKRILALQSDGELDGYTYRVAGCVGEFWTKICRSHPLKGATLDDNFLIQNGVRYGKGLQMVNILRDINADLRRGRCYLPRERLAAVGLKPEDLLQAPNEAKFRPVYHEYLKKAEEHLRAGWEYTNALPRNQWRLRLACAWPILIGIRTISKLRKTDILSTGAPVKIDRKEVRQIMWKSALGLLLASRWSKLLDQAANT